MVRKSDKRIEKIIKGMKAARTAQEMVDSWDACMEGGQSVQMKERWNFYSAWQPELIEVHAHKPFLRMMERGVLEPKTRELIMLGMLAVLGSSGGVLWHTRAALAAGCTPEEIMEIPLMSVYILGKANMSTIQDGLNTALKAAGVVKK